MVRDASLPSLQAELCALNNILLACGSLLCCSSGRLFHTLLLPTVIPYRLTAQAFMAFSVLLVR